MEARLIPTKDREHIINIQALALFAAISKSFKCRNAH